MKRPKLGRRRLRVAVPLAAEAGGGLKLMYVQNYDYVVPFPSLLKRGVG